jgi:hypothetical protein|tara:strand:- start:7120 stop:7341 length:222 start_codon:yes stop_codon:yes gene_type:complete
MIPKSLLLGMLKPLLPKLEGFLKNHPDLKENEQSRVVLRVEDAEIVIEIMAYLFEDDKVVGIRKLQSVDPKDL